MQFRNIFLSLVAQLCFIQWVSAQDLGEILCSDNVKARNGIMTCLKQLPGTMKKMSMECRKETMPAGAANDEKFRMKICEDKDLVMKMETCMKMKKENMPNLSPADEKRRGKAVECVGKALTTM